MGLLRSFQQEQIILAFGKFSLLLGKEGRSAFGWRAAGSGLCSLDRKQKQLQAQTTLTGVRGNNSGAPFVLVDPELSTPGCEEPAGWRRRQAAVLQEARAPAERWAGSQPRSPRAPSARCFQIWA